MRTPRLAGSPPALALLAALAACGSGGGGDPVMEPSFELVPIAAGLASPVHLSAPTGDRRLYVVEQGGRIRVIENRQLRAAPFLDIAAKVRAGGEQGLLSLAFHPDHRVNGLLFVAYTDLDGAVRVERYRRAADGATADPASARTIIVVPHPFDNHNGGQVAFGPDGMLYVSVGDGGSGGDPQGNGQRLTTLLGKVLRLDVNAGDPYAIPADNPFVGRTGARPEIWALGLRNPWRFSFDAPTSRLYLSDVGQGAWEEVNVASATAPGLNYGWVTMEGAHCYNAPTCDRTGLTLPGLEYANDDATCAVAGGHVYRGVRSPDLAGLYFYSDYCAGWLRSFRWDGTSATERRQWATGLGNVTSFGTDSDGELYVLTGDGAVRMLSAPPPTDRSPR